ncbi:hypothetical protein [Streptomyces sp. NPDC058280]|uniref:hypothetical protein n=1 Tax=Streptomyces sp. NPDC058280 TaxID=3346419 RepID=UPI0036F045B5
MSLPRVPDPYVWRAIRGEDIRLVRPYVLAHERRMWPGPACGCRTGPVCTTHRTAVAR